MVISEQQLGPGPAEPMSGINQANAEFITFSARGAADSFAAGPAASPRPRWQRFGSGSSCSLCVPRPGKELFLASL